MLRLHKAKMFVATGLVVLVSGCSFAASANANSYDVWSCRGPAGQPLSAAAWNTTESDAVLGDAFVIDNCSAGGTLTLNMNPLGIPGGRRARLDFAFDLPRDATISSYRLVRSISTSFEDPGSNYDYAAGIRESSGGTFSDQGCASTPVLPDFPCNDIGNTTDPADPANVVDRPVTSLSGLSAWVGCLTDGCDPPQSFPPAEFKLYGSRVSIVDNDPPTITEIGGSLTGTGSLSGRADLFVDAADTNGGIASMSMLMDGVPYRTIDTTTSATCVTPFEVPRPCPAEAGRQFPVDTGALAPGPHIATGQVVDAAGNSTPFGPVAFTVARPDPPPPANGSPAGDDPVLSLDSKLIEHAAGKPASVTGSLAATDGQPVAGARIEVNATDLGSRSSEPMALPAVLTAADGRFAVPIRGAGAKSVAVSFSPVIGGVPTRTASAKVRSEIAVSLKAKPRKVAKGRPVSFRGRLSGTGTAAKGANLEIQAISGGKWQTVANVVTKANGTFVWKYRFKYVRRDALFSFRALVRGAPGWPWPSTASKRIKVRIKVG